MWLHHVLGEHRLSWIRQRCHRQLRRSQFPRTKHRGVGAVTPPVGLLAVRYATQAHGEAGVIRLMGYNARNDESLSRRLDWNRRAITGPALNLTAAHWRHGEPTRRKQTNACAERQPMPGEDEQLC